MRLINSKVCEIDGLKFIVSRQTYSEGYAQGEFVAKWDKENQLFDVIDPQSKTRIQGGWLLSASGARGWINIALDGHLGHHSESAKMAFDSISDDQRNVLREHFSWVASLDCQNFIRRIRQQKAFL